MDEQLKLKIELLLSEKSALVNKEVIPDNYKTVQEAILLTELKQEIAKINLMLKDPENFEPQFLQQCEEREVDKATISIHEYPQSLANKLYWDIASLVFKPKSMKEMLNIVAPGIKNQLTAKVEYERKEATQSYQVHGSLQLLPDLANLSEVEPKFETLSHYILQDNLIFDVKAVACLPLQIQVELQDQLENDYPDVANRLYDHNLSFTNLYQDIRTINSKGTTPKSAIEQLIKGLQSGGEKMTGGKEASFKALNAVNRFMEYLNSLPNDTQKTLKALTSQNGTLGEILNRFSKNECVEETSLYLTRLLNANSNAAILNSPTGISKAELIDLKNKYANADLLDPVKENSFNFFPDQITKEVIKQIEINEENENLADNLTTLVINFPPHFYDMLWTKIELEKPDVVFDELRYIIAAGFLESEQSQALAQTIVDQYHRFKTEITLLNWATLTENPIFLNEALKNIPQGLRFKEMTTLDSEGSAPIHYADRPEMLKLLLDSLPVNERLEALKVKNKEGETSLYMASNNPEMLENIFSLLPEKDQSVFLNYILKFPESVNAMFSLMDESVIIKVLETNTANGIFLHSLLADKDKLSILPSILTKLSDENRLKVFAIKNENGENIVHLAAEKSPTFRAILPFIPTKDLAGVLMAENKNKLTPVHIAISNFDKKSPLIDTLSKIPENLHEVLTKADKAGRTPMHDLINNPKLIGSVLEMLPEEKRLQLLNVPDNDRKSPGDQIIMPEILKDVLEKLSKNDQDTFLFTTRGSGPPYLHYTSLPPVIDSVLPVLLKTHTPIEILNLWSTPNKESGNSSLGLASRNADNLQQILEFIPQEDVLQFAKKTDDEGRTLLHYATSEALATPVWKEKILNTKTTLVEKTKAINVILDLYPEDQRFKAITTKDIKNRSPFENADWKNQIQMLSKLDNEGRLNLFKGSQGSLLNRFDNSDFLKTLASDSQFEAMKYKDEKGSSMLHRVKNLDSLAEIIPLINPENRIELFMSRDKDGKTPLDKFNYTSSELNEKIKPLLEDEWFKLFPAKKISDELSFDAISCFESLQKENLLTENLQTALKHNIDLQDLVVKIFNSEFKDTLKAETLANNRSVQEFLLGLVASSPDVLQLANPKLMNNPSFMLDCVSKNISTLQYASPELKSNPEFIKVAARINSKILGNLPEQELTKQKPSLLHYEHAKQNDSRYHFYEAKITLDYKKELNALKQKDNSQIVEQPQIDEIGKKYSDLVTKYSIYSKEEAKKVIKVLTGDALKTAILQNFRTSLDGKSVDEINVLSQEFKKSGEYEILKTQQGITSWLFDINTTSQDAVDAIIEDAKEIAGRYNKPQF